ncbi:hypothetical protein ON010_g6849 [Phytophthora cinnamomi]|nr:hypothetical protein ON010_g6849 [Phytophthora cinnamomi]
MQFISLVQVLLVTMVVLLASTNAVASNEIVSSTSTATTRNLVSFDTIDPKKTLKSTEEERGAAAAATGGAAAGNTVVVPNKEQTGKSVTVTKYYNNGLLQRFTRWFKRTFGNSNTSQKSSEKRRLRQQSGTVAKLLA